MSDYCLSERERERERERECAALHLDPLGGHSQVIAYTVTLRV